MWIRSEECDDAEPVRQVVERAFEQEEEAGLVDELRAQGDVEFALVALLEEEVVGHLMLSNLAAPVRALALAPVAVDPAHQGQGVGSAMIRQALDLAKSNHWQAVFVLGDPGFYERFGFSAELAVPFESPYAGEHFMALELEPNSLRGQTGTVEYAAAFGSL